MALNRDDFKRKTIETLAKRVGYICSNPTCQKLTVGSNKEDSKSTLLGVAAHITAASIGGPRYDEKLTYEQRISIHNGIWLCANCATLIDKDIVRYTKEVLLEWKIVAEEKTSKMLSGAIEQEIKISGKPIIEIDITGSSRARYPNGVSDKNPFEMYDGQRKYINPKIYHWALNWNYKLVIINNSSYPAYNLQIESIGKVHLTELGTLPRKNNLSPLNTFELDIVYADNIESESKIADEILNPNFPEKFNDLVLRVNFVDEQRNNHSTIVQFKDGQVINLIS